MELAILAQFVRDWHDDEIGGGAETVPHTASSTVPFPSTEEETDDQSISSNDREERVDSTPFRAPRMSRSTLCRRRQRGEIHRLQTEAASLENQIQRLLQRPNIHGGEVSVLQDAAWKRQAAHQFMLRRNSEDKNAVLRKLVQAQEKIVQQLTAVFNESCAVNSATQQELRSFDQQQRRFVTIMNHIGHVPLRLSPYTMPRVFDDDAFWMGDLEREVTRLVYDSSGQVAAESTSMKVFPFGVSATGASFWNTFSSMCLPLREGHPEHTDSWESHLVGGFEELLAGADSWSAWVRAKFIMRLVQNDPERVVIAFEDVPWPSTDTPSERLEVTINGCLCLDRTGVSSTRVRVVTLQTIKGRAAMLLSKHEVERACEAVGEFHLNTYRGVCVQVETSLIDDALNHKIKP